MAAQVVLNRAALAAILRGSEGKVVPELERRGRRVATAAGPRYEAETWVGRNRARVTVRSTRPVPSSDWRVLSGALSAGRG